MSDGMKNTEMVAFTALADPTRRMIVEMLSGGELTAGEIGARFSASGAAISQHLKVLKAARLVRVRPEGQRRIYELDPAGLYELDIWFKHVKRNWPKQLKALDQLLEAVEQQRPNAQA